ncbi:Glutaredoxin 2 [Phytophthora citrophthora]|uniref:Glutaredoxin 2 n=1 Tax=Phytophthora citrophthora TaxID=4793 RepID=A0AAD9LM04_9STRA|nr:Glutaredoxin 2 [Phytophthora citrophthora]
MPQSGKGTRFFPNLKRDDWVDVLCPTTSVNPHPLKELGCPQVWIHNTLSEYVSLRRCFLPVVHDVMLRMVFGDLILGLRLYFLKTLNPTVQKCVRESCTAIETVEHCFLSCPALEEMWRSLWASWKNIAKNPELVKQVNQLLKELDPLLHSNHSVNAELSYDDLDLFGRLRGLTFVKDVEWPAKAREFLEYFSQEGDVPLYDNVVKI